MRGAATPGERIRVDKLCAQIGVSRTPVREALVALEREGLVRTVPGRGYFVREISFREALDAYQLRIILEPLATALAARRIRDAELPVLRELASVSTDGSEESITEAVERNREFHVRIAQASGNARLAEIMADLMDDTERLLYIELDTDHPQSEWEEEHLLILKALEERNPNQAAQASRATFTRDSMFLSAQAKLELANLLGSIGLAEDSGPAATGGVGLETGPRSRSSP